MRAPVDRRHRQQVEVVVAAVGGDRGRALVLGREHLLEFPDDDVVRAVVDQLGRFPPT